MRRLGGFADRLARSVRVKLLALVLAPLLLGVPLLLGMVWSWGSKPYDRLADFKISSDLVTAHEYFEAGQSGVGRDLSGWPTPARSPARSPTPPPNASRSASCNRWRSPTGWFCACSTATAGCSAAAAGQPRLPAEWPGMPAVAAAMTGAALTSVEVVDASTLEAIDPALRRRAYPAAGAHRAAAPDPRSFEGSRHDHPRRGTRYTTTRGISSACSKAACCSTAISPSSTASTPSSTGDSLPLGSLGTATLFLGDTRIATNVRLFEGPSARLAHGSRRRCATRCWARAATLAWAPPSW